MTVYNVSGNVALSAQVATESEALTTLRNQVGQAGFDLVDEKAYHVGLPGSPGWLASGLIAGLFEADGTSEAKAKMIHYVTHKAKIVPTDLVAIESENVPKEWVR